MPPFAAEYALCEKLPLQPGARTRVDDARVDRPAGLLLAAPELHRVTRRAEVPAEMDTDHGVPFLDARADEHPVADEARVVHQHVEPAEGVDGRLHQAPRRPPSR